MRTRTFIGFAAIVVVVGLGGFLGVRGSLPGRLVQAYSVETLVSEAATMVECAECHEEANFHGCDTCHDDHGAVELEDVPFYAVVAVTGDVPTPGFVLLDDILPYRDHPHTHLPLLTFLADQGVTSFESVTLASDDGGFVTIQRDQLADDALLLPYEDGIRFAAEGLHVSTWIKGLSRVVVVGTETPLNIDGTPTSLGRLLLGPTRAVTVEQTDVMFRSEEDGQVRRASTASRLEGAAVSDIVANPGFATLQIRTTQGDTVELSREVAWGAILTQLQEDVALVLPGQARNAWIRGVAELRSGD